MPIHDKDSTPIWKMTIVELMSKYPKLEIQTNDFSKPLWNFTPKTEEEIAKEKEKEAYLKDLQTKVGTNFNVQENLFKGSVEDLNLYLENTKLKGMGQVFLNAQKEYGVNAIFLMGIVQAESTYGAGTKNLTGIIGGSKYTYTQNIMTCAKTLSGKLYFGAGLNTIEKIKTRYCSDPNWINKVTKEINKINQTILKKYE